MAGDIEHKELLELTSNIAAAHVSNNQMSVDEIPALIQKIYRTLSTVQADNEGLNERPQPAVPIKKSVLPDHIICLEDGKKLKMLKRHLQTAYGMSPEDYRERWGLPADYPMVAPNYAKERSRLAKEIGLGKNTGKNTHKS
jgi:predicted transcriptional regulator